MRFAERMVGILKRKGLQPNAPAMSSKDMSQWLFKSKRKSRIFRLKFENKIEEKTFWGALVLVDNFQFLFPIQISRNFPIKVFELYTEESFE